MMEQKLKQSGSAAAADEVNLNLRLSRMLGVSVGAVAPSSIVGGGGDGSS